MIRQNNEARRGDSARQGGDPPMTTSDNISAIEAVEKALGRVPLEEWSIGENDHRSVFAGKHEVAFMPIHDFRVSEAKTFAAYIAACNPVAMSAILALARKAEAMELEIAELREVMKGCHAALKMMIDPSDISGSTVTTAFAAALPPRRARTLLNGGSDAQG